MIQPALADDAFVADVAAAQDPEEIYVWWLGQSGFLIKWRGRHLLIDPYLSDSLTRKYAGTRREHIRMSRHVVDPRRLDFVDLVCSTHGHTDHLDAETLEPILAAGASLICPPANRELAVDRLGRAPDVCLGEGDRATVAGFEVEAVPAAHPERAPEYAGYLVDCAGRRIYHSGDSVVFDDMADMLRAKEPTLALLPINGAFGNMSGLEAARLAHSMATRLVVPCHYDMFEFNTASPAAFVAECRRLDQPYALLRAGERLTLPAAA